MQACSGKGDVQLNTRVSKTIRRLAVISLFAPALAGVAGAAWAASELHLDKATVSTEPAALQNGARIFVNYCLNCHSASVVRYGALTQIGIPDSIFEKNIVPLGKKKGDMMISALSREDAEAWFGTVPPDLSVIARAKASESGTGADYLYSYLRGFYRDNSRPTGWNNRGFDNVGMPHALWELQGQQTAKVTIHKVPDGTEEKDGKKVTKFKDVKEVEIFDPAVSGTLSKAEYDQAVNDLVSYMVWMGEPSAGLRKTIGIFVLLFLAGLYVLAHALGKTYWKNIH